MDRICPNVDRCIDLSKQAIQQGCGNEMTSPRVDFFLKYGLAISFKSKCLRDNSNQYCRKQNTSVFCNDCLPKHKLLVQQIMASAPQENRDRALSWQNRNSGCSSNGNVYSNPTASLSDFQQEWPPVADGCQQAINNAISPTSTECSLPIEPTEADMNRMCPNTDRCIEASKQLIRQGCGNEMNNARVDFFVKFGIDIRFKSNCLRDNNNQLCQRQNTASFCNDCLAKRKQLVQQIMATSPQDMRDRAMNWQDRTSGCNNALTPTVTTAAPSFMNGTEVNVWPPASSSCEQAIESAKRPISAECALPKGRTDMDMDRVCPNIDRCIDLSKQLIQQGCANEMSNQKVDFYFQYGIAIRFKSKCSKDNMNQYCRKRNTASFCSDCMAKRKLLADQIMANAPQQNKDRALMYLERRTGCTTGNNIINGVIQGGQTILGNSGATLLHNFVLMSFTVSLILLSTLIFW
jgi:hypothetical protein